MTDTVGSVNEIRKNKIKRVIFIVAMIIVPMLNFIVFYVYVNFNSILMSFQTISNTGETKYTLDWFKLVIDAIFVRNDMLVYLNNTMIYFLTSL